MKVSNSETILKKPSENSHNKNIPIQEAFKLFCMSQRDSSHSPISKGTRGIP